MATVEQSYDSCGIVYTSRTRCGYSPKFTVTRNDRDRTSTDLVVWPAAGHPATTLADMGEIVHALANRYHDRKIFALEATNTNGNSNGTNGKKEVELVLIFEPKEPNKEPSKT